MDVKVLEILGTVLAATGTEYLALRSRRTEREANISLCLINTLTRGVRSELSQHKTQAA